MAQWGEGYITDLPYTSGFFREMTPGWLAMAALLRGYRPPDLTRPLRYADLGCGTGFTATVVAATMPQAEVWGFDFNPAHIEAATRLAAEAKLPNVRFREASFADLAEQPARALPEFDFIVSHGVLTHVSAENRRLLFDLIGRWLKPGGLAYLGYSVAVGWAAMAPARALMRMLAADPDGPEAGLRRVPDAIARLRAAGARFFADNPAVEARLEAMQRQDPRYLAHEYLGEAWQPMMFAEVADAMTEIGCGYIGSATLVENIDAVSVPPGCLRLLADRADVRRQETLRDFARSQAFRRDVYRRGLAPLAKAERAELLDSLELASLGWPTDPVAALDTPVGPLARWSASRQPMLEAIGLGRAGVRQTRDAAVAAGWPAEEATQELVLLVAAGRLHPALPNGLAPEALAQAARLNRALIRAVAGGGDVTQLVMPATGAALRTDVVEMLLVSLLLDGEAAEPEALADRLRALLDARDQSGATRQSVERAFSGTLPALRKLVAFALARRAPFLRASGALHAEPSPSPDATCTAPGPSTLSWNGSGAGV